MMFGAGFDNSSSSNGVNASLAGDTLGGDGAVL
jgi:hypothetical protein